MRSGRTYLSVARNYNVVVERQWGLVFFHFFFFLSYDDINYDREITTCPTFRTRVNVCTYAYVCPDLSKECLCLYVAYDTSNVRDNYLLHCRVNATFVTRTTMSTRKRPNTSVVLEHRRANAVYKIAKFRLIL